ncbi:uncharacterized protein VTP21DRAFT_7696 [Calcarisporiella thermophila]|uniref:uncharacterized protein n=1 Tax=Calcarisporiella thermophila TaxID=911321 RepID=UPI003742C8E9
MKDSELVKSASKLLKYVFIGYLVISLLYTAHHLFELYRGEPRLKPKPIPPNPKELLAIPQSPQQLKWSNSLGVTEDMPESFMLSKVFSDAMGPSRVIPYYFKAERVPEKEDITIATLVTANRFTVFSRLVTHYQGPVSVAIHVQDDDSKDQLLESLHAMYDENPHMKTFVDIHLVVDPFERQFNMWRNVAKFFARSNYVMMLDVDFHLCTDFRKSIQNDPKLMQVLREGKGALVVPAFEFNEQEDGMDYKTFPTTKQELVKIQRDDKIDMFHRSWWRGHGSTNYTRWYDSTEPYKVTSYQYSYEPYIIYRKEGSPWCDERFVGYGANKAACLYEIYLSGIDYWVLPNDFLIHQTHPYPESSRKKERKYNRKLYDNFREEVCLRYMRAFMASGEWDTPRADNLKAECSKIKGFRSAAAQLEREL